MADLETALKALKAYRERPDYIEFKRQVLTEFILSKADKDMQMNLLLDLVVENIKEAARCNHLQCFLAKAMTINDTLSGLCAAHLAESDSNGSLKHGTGNHTCNGTRNTGNK